MATITIPNVSQLAGIPSQGDDVIVGADIALITGDTPGVVTEDLLVAANQTLAALTVVGLNGAGAVVPASDVIAPIGILVAAVTTGAAATLKGAPVYRAGVFNPLALVWPATIATEALRIAAFRGAPAPTNIIMRRPKTASVS